ncbi:hypothetical protein KEG57_35275 [Polyangium jinanense]|uniref:Uncharacterized protein n=1 Tax=Polyangium jinanense TaxID=2829994 RepID=A0A9X3XD06_9BACT|nr:hypothetical protein [Polyangium jinanense]
MSKDICEDEADTDNASEDEAEPNAAMRLIVFKRVLEHMVSEASADPLRLAVILEALAVLDSRRSDNSAEGDEALVRAASLAMTSAMNETLVAVASQKSGHDVKADMTQIRLALDRATLAIAWHGDEQGAQYAKGFIHRLARMAEDYTRRDNGTFKDAVIGALRSLSHARLAGGRSVLFPNYNAIARAVLRNKRTQPGVEKQVAALEKALPEQLAPYICDTGYRAGVNLGDVARVALKAGGVDPYDVLDAPAKMRETRLREKLGEKPPGKRRQPRVSKRKP